MGSAWKDFWAKGAPVRVEVQSAGDGAAAPVTSASFCPKCGRPLAEGDAFCAGCGVAAGSVAKEHGDLFGAAIWGILFPGIALPVGIVMAVSDSPGRRRYGKQLIVWSALALLAIGVVVATIVGAE